MSGVLVIDPEELTMEAEGAPPLTPLHPSPKTAIVVGRFQVPRLTDGHQFILRCAEKQGHLVVFLRCGSKVDNKNPLTYEMRQSVVRQAFSFAEIHPLYDQGTDVEWAETLDDYVDSRYREPTFYCGPSSEFHKDYQNGGGKHPVVSFKTEVCKWSGSVVREAVWHYPLIGTETFHAGVIYGVRLALDGKDKVH